MAAGMPVESPARWKPHTGFGGRVKETRRAKARWRALTRPYWAILEDEFDCLLVNARHVKQVPGRKTDVSDAAWLCQLAEAGLLKANLSGRPTALNGICTAARAPPIQPRPRDPTGR
jgi:hypothetical protein